jgi:hypothetical protein
MNGKTIVLAIGLATAAFNVFQVVPPAAAQSGEGWVTLLDDKTIGEWNQVGESNWRSEEGVLVADKRSSKDFAYLVSKNPYKDFVLQVEFWASDDANSGVLIRCGDAGNIADRTCYEVNIFDGRKDQSYGTAAITHFAEVNPMPKVGGRWNTYEITAKGRHMTVVLNGQKTAELRNALFAEGPVALQHAGGTIKFRKIAIKSLQP